MVVICPLETSRHVYPEKCSINCMVLFGEMYLSNWSNEMLLHGGRGGSVSRTSLSSHAKGKASRAPGGAFLQCCPAKGGEGLGG